MYVDIQAYLEDDRTLKAKRVISKAYDLIKQHGWVKGHYIHGDKHCIVGAVREAANNNDGLELRAVELLGRIIGVRSVDRVRMLRAIETWNDHPKRTKRQVLDVMKKASAP